MFAYLAIMVAVAVPTFLLIFSKWVNRIPWIDRPTTSSNGAIVFTGFRALNVATVTRPTDWLQVIQIKEMFEVTFMRLQVVYDRASWVIPTHLQDGFAGICIRLV